VPYDRDRRVDLARPFQIDANRINARGSLPNMTRLEKWHADGVVHISMADVAQMEAATGSNARARKAFSLIHSVSTNLTADEERMLRRIADILFPGGARNPNERDDALIVFHAWKYKSTLITNDGDSRSQPGGILGHRDELAHLGIVVISDADAVSWVDEQIRKRDERALLMSRDFGKPIPPWVGKD